MRKFSLTLLLSVSLFAFATDNIIVRQNSGDTAYGISTISSITFPTDGSGVVLNFNDGTSKTFSRGQFVSLRFNQLTGADFVDSNDNHAILYNNSTSEIIILGDESAIEVYATNGALVAEGKGTVLNVSQLSAGTYVVKAAGLTSKIVKR